MDIGGSGVLFRWCLVWKGRKKNRGSKAPREGKSWAFYDCGIQPKGVTKPEQGSFKTMGQKVRADHSLEANLKMRSGSGVKNTTFRLCNPEILGCWWSDPLREAQHKGDFHLVIQNNRLLQRVRTVLERDSWPEPVSPCLSARESKCLHSDFPFLAVFVVFIWQWQGYGGREDGLGGIWLVIKTICKTWWDSFISGLGTDASSVWFYVQLHNFIDTSWY